MESFLSVDRFCLIGGGLFAIGFLVALVALFRWMVTGFGNLDPDINVRLAAVATLDPDGAPNTAQATIFECIRPPGSQENHCAMALYIFSAMPVRNMISPIMT